MKNLIFVREWNDDPTSGLWMDTLSENKPVAAEQVSFTKTSEMKASQDRWRTSFDNLEIKHRGEMNAAIDRLKDMLKGDDAQAWKEAQRFVDMFEGMKS